MLTKHCLDFSRFDAETPQFHLLINTTEIFNGTIGAVPDPLTGQKLSGFAADHQDVQKALAELGVNPLVISAFRTRPAGENASVV